MKKIFLVILVAFLLGVSCNEQEKKMNKVNFAIISGELLNDKDKIVHIYNPNTLIKKEIEVKSDGTFIDTLKNIEPGIYHLYSNRNRVKFYLEKEYDLNLVADVKNFRNTLHITGKGRLESEYMNKRDSIVNNHFSKKEELFTLNEDSFKLKLKELSNDLQINLKKSENLNQSFVEKEKRNINYIFLSNLKKYVRYHPYYTKNDEFEVSNEFLKDFNDFDYNSVVDFTFAPAYKEIVTDHYMDKASEIRKKDSISRNNSLFKSIETIPNQRIKNILVFESVKQGISYAKELEDYYQKFLKISTNKENEGEITEMYSKLLKIQKGKTSPKFHNYSDINGKKVSLDDFKGKYVYIDVWATWCGPCIRQIPFLKELEKKYHNKNVEFVSISVDEEENYEKWKKMVKEEELEGIQLIADNNFESTFIKEYLINGIPRFILIDPQGKIIDRDAPRPSNESLIELFEEIGI